jgi:hypothetical protein
MLREVEAGRITEFGFALLKKSDLVALVQARLTAAGVPEDSQPDGEQIRRWQVERLKAMGL